MRSVTIIGNDGNKRIVLGMEYIKAALESKGYEVEVETAVEKPEDYRKLQGEKIYVGVRGEDAFLAWLEEKEVLIYHSRIPEGEGFYLESCPGSLTVIAGGSDSGALYGCLELEERIKEEDDIPKELAFYDGPAFKLRGPCIGLQKTKIEPPRLTYEYPVTPDRFPWFYDLKSWKKLLDMMLRERCNVLYIWSGHPFSSFVKVPDYPEALEVTEEEFVRNQQIFGWLTEECDKRGIWVVLKFYNIHIPYPFAVKHKLELLQSNIHPLVADYTTKTIVEFIKAYPHIGLMVCLGEALRGTQNKTDWFVDTIVPAVKQGIKEAGITEEPPIILRGHDCDPIAAMKGAMEQYSNLYTMWKYNGESLTTYFPKGKWQKTHEELSSIGTTHIMNVHVLANLEPFRFNAPAYIQKCVQAGMNRLGANGLHLYPLFYWDWPYSPDKTEPRTNQLDRDWMWYSAWFRYAWNPDRTEKTEYLYWDEEIAKHYKCSREGARYLLDAMEAAANCAPKILGRVGITEGNRQTMSLGMLMSQLTNVVRYRPNRELWKSVARAGEQPDDFIIKELNKEPHVGETPYDLAEEVEYLLSKADRACLEAKKLLPDNGEINGIFTDIEAIGLMCKNYVNKIKGAMKILEYKYTMKEDCSGDFALLEEAYDFMEKAMEEYRKLADLTDMSYLYANSMQTKQRKIPFPDGDAFGHWRQCLPEYEKELKNFKNNLKKLKEGLRPGNQEEDVKIERLPEAEFTLLSKDSEVYVVGKGESIFTDAACGIQNCAPEILGLKGIRFGLGEAISNGAAVTIELKEESYVLIGYINSKGVEWLQVPDLETNTHADDRGGLAVIYANAVKAEGCEPVNIHAFLYEKGIHDIYFGTGGFMIAGVIPAAKKPQPRNAGLEGEGLETLDWLYE
jgi:hypothetical protein